MRYFHFAVVALLLFALTSCVSMKEPVFNKIENVEVQPDKISKEKTLVTVHLRYFNPNNKSAKIKHAEGQAWMDSTFLGNFVVDQEVEIPANADFFVPVKLEVDMKHLLKNSITVFLNSDVLITVKGKVRVGRGGFYKKVPFKYEGKQNLQQLLGK